ncbi:MAG: DinB family protein [Candidatus Rokubacteria bacterium]|nr:DinB family protein [Candidatus Rokubacteria bacterium]
MTAAELIQTELTRLHAMLTTSIEGLTAAQLHAVPGGHATANTIAWGLWHVVRTEDNVGRFVLQNRRTPVWTDGGYADKLGLPPVAQGTGMSAADAHALRLDNLEMFREYMTKVWASTDEFVRGLDPAALDRPVTIKPLGDMTVGRALAQVCVAHGFMHVGEIELARTLVGGSGA